MIVILDYGIGNIGSIVNILKKIGVHAELSNNPDVLENATKLILPGVGSFDYCMKQFNSSGLRDAVERKITDQRIPILGVCVGCQMLMEKSEEGNEKGLGWISGNVVKFKKELLAEEYKIPHMGWTDVEPRNNPQLFSGIDEPRFYFVHSYHIEISDPQNITSEAVYGYRFTASVGKDNIQGVQFHPEKSHKFGMRLYQNFVNSAQ